MASQSRTDIAFGFWDPWMGNGMDGIESKQRTAALGGHATDLYTAGIGAHVSASSLGRRPDVQNNSLRIGTVQLPPLAPQAMASPKGEALPAESRYRDDISAPLTDHRTPAPKPDRATSSPC
jgi:hypothetical protein